MVISIVILLLLGQAKLYMASCVTNGKYFSMVFIGVRGVFLQTGGYFPAHHVAGLLQLCRGGKCWAVK